MSRSFKAFARSLGYLPLALDLAANQVQDGLSWAELRQEFEAERREMALELLDSSECWEKLDEQQQRNYSLQACLNLSLRQLSPSRLKQFAWLGVLSEDVLFDERMTQTLWQLPQSMAEQVLIDFRRKSLLMEHPQSGYKLKKYRLHDLIHDVARSLIEKGNLDSDITFIAQENASHLIRNRLCMAHQELLVRYLNSTPQRQWHRLSNDQYIYQNLTWHMERANWKKEIHALLSSENENGKNLWLESCERINQAHIFRKDLNRAWLIAEKSYTENRCRSIIFQCRYALITSILNEVSRNIPIKVILDLLKLKVWTIQQVLEYVEKMHEQESMVEIIRGLSPYLSFKLFSSILERAENLTVQQNPTLGIRILGESESRNIKILVEISRSIMHLYEEAGELNQLDSIAEITFIQLSESLENLRYAYNKVEIMTDIARRSPRDFFVSAWAIFMSSFQLTTKARALSKELENRSLERLSHSQLRAYLKILSYRSRVDLVQDFHQLSPAITRLGGKEAFIGVVQAIEDVYKQWPEQKE